MERLASRLVVRAQPDVGCQASQPGRGNFIGPQASLAKAAGLECHAVAMHLRRGGVPRAVFHNGVTPVEMLEPLEFLPRGLDDWL